MPRRGKSSRRKALQTFLQEIRNGQGRPARCETIEVDPQAQRWVAAILLAASLLPATAKAQSADEIPAGETLAEPPAEKAESARASVMGAQEDQLHDWLSKKEKEEEEEEAVSAPQEEERFEVDTYGSARLEYRIDKSESKLVDANSRFGVWGVWNANDTLEFFARAEAGINVLDGVSGIFEPGTQKDEDSGKEVFDRLLYAGFRTPRFMGVIGKNWSAYYQVAQFSDEFDSTGGSASGTYNAGTDGGPTGTGRADLALQAIIPVRRLARSLGADSFHLNVQAQDGRRIPGVEGAKYGISFGMSGILELTDNTDIGLAYNFADVTEPKRSDLRAAGIDGNAQALVIGMRTFEDNWYLGTTIARLKNHEATDNMHYFDGWGWEVYGRYQLWKKLWVVGGWNWLEPDSDQFQAGKFRERYGVIGLRYSFDGLRRLVYIEGRIDDGRLEDGSSPGSSIVIGVRWDLN